MIANSGAGKWMVKFDKNLAIKSRPIPVENLCVGATAMVAHDELMKLKLKHLANRKHVASSYRQIA